MKPKFPHLRSLVLAGSTLLSISYAHAADGTWDTDSPGNWTDITNWLGNADYASGADSTATLGDFITGDRIITLDTGITIGNITASDISNNYTISGANILTLDRTSGVPTIDVITGRTLTIGSQISGNDGLQKAGAGTLVLSGSNDFAGGLVLNAGTLQGLVVGTSLAPVSPLGAGGVTLNGGTLQLRASGTLNTTGETIIYGNNVTVGGDTSISVDRPGATSTNKTIQLGTLAIGANTLSVSGGNSYGLRFQGATTLSGNATISNTATVTLADTVGETGAARNLTKSGSGTLILSGNNTFTGDVEVNAGTLQLSGNNSLRNITVNGATLTSGGSDVGRGTLGLDGGTITFTGTSSYNPQRSNSQGVLLYNKNVNISSGTTTFNQSTQYYKEAFSGVLSGAGTLVKNDSNGTLAFSNGANTFTGAIRLDGGSGGLTVNSLADSANAITFNGNTGAFSLGAGTASSLVFGSSGRQIVLAHANGGEIANNNGSSSNTITINSNLGFSGTGTRLLELGGTNVGANAFNGDITNNGLSATSVTKSGSGTWILSGTNTHSGATGFGGAQNGGTLILQGAASASVNSSFSLSEGSTLGLRDDTVGTVTFGAPMQVNLTSQQTSARATSNINVNRISTGSNSTLAIGKLNFAGITDNRAAGATVNVAGGNGYKLGIGSIDLDWGLNGSQNLNPTSASVIVTGTVQHINGRPATGTSVQNSAVGTAGMGFVLDGTATGNLISGAIKNSADFDDLSNANALPLTLTKQGTGTWTLSGTNTYTGTTTISGGKLLLGSTGSLAAGSAVTVSGGALGGTGTVNGTVALTTAGGIDLRDNAIGNLTLAGTLDITGAAGANNLTFDLGNTTGTSDQILVAGATTVTNTGAAVIVPNQLGGAAGRTATTYTLIGGTGTLDAANFAKFSLATTAAFGQTYSLTNTSDDLQLVATNVTSATPAAFWKGGTNNWSDAANWNTDAASNIAAGAAPDYQTNVTFSTTAPAPANLLTNVLDVDFDINSLTLTNASGNVTIGGTKMLTIEAAGVNGNAAGNGIDSQKTSGTNTISAKVGLASSQTWTVATSGTLAVSGAISDFGAGYALTKAGGGNLSLTGATTYTGGTAITGGTLTVNGTSLGAINNGPLTLSGGGRLTVSGANIASASQVSVGAGGGLMSVSGNNNFTTTGKLTGSGTLTLVDVGGSGGKTFNFNSLENDFTGGIILSGAAGLALNINSLANSSNNIAFTAASGSVTAAYGSGAIAPLSLSTRAIEINSAGALTGTIQNNNTIQAISIGGNLVATGAGTKILGLGAVAGPSNVYSGAIVNATDAGSGTIGVTKTGAGAWAITNTANTFSGTIAVNDGTLAYASAGGSNGISFTNTTGSATLSYTGAAKEMTGAINASTVTSGTITLDASGSGAINYSNTASLGSTGTSVKNLILSGTSAGDNILAGAWVNNGTGAATLTKNGAGTWVLSSTNNTHTGATAVNAGKLLINGSTSVSSVFNVASGATLGGTGAIGGTVAVANGATLSPGATIESLVTGAVTMASGSSFAYGATGSGATGADLLAVNGSLLLTSVTLDLALANAALSGGAWNNGDKLTLMSYIDAGAGITSGFTGYADGSGYTFGSNVWTFDYNDTTAGGNYLTDATAAGQNRFVTMTVTIPEPSSVALLGTLGAMLLIRRRR